MGDAATGAGHQRADSTAANVERIAGIGTALVAVNILLMLLVSYTPVAGLGAFLFSNYFAGIVTFAVTIGGGLWLTERGTSTGRPPLVGVGVSLTQLGYTLLGAAILVVAPAAMRLPALGITTVVTGVLTAGVVVVVYNTTRSFERWQTYSAGLFVVGFILGGIGSITGLEPLLVGASVLFFLGFVLDLCYEIWAVRERRYESDLRNAVGVYVAVMGVFVHVLQLVLRTLSALDQ